MAWRTSKAETVARVRRLAASAPRSVFESAPMLMLAVVAVARIAVSFLTPYID
jgi:hypothetical protein